VFEFLCFRGVRAILHREFRAGVAAAAVIIDASVDLFGASERRARFRVRQNASTIEEW
jgi:hypothetical protein